MVAVASRAVVDLATNKAANKATSRVASWAISRVASKVAEETIRPSWAAATSLLVS